MLKRIKDEVQGEETSTKLKNLQIRHEVETAEHEAELQRLKNVELAGALERLKQAQSQLVQSEKMAAVGNLVAGVVHELNSPAAALVSGMDVQVRAAARIRALAGKAEDDAAALERALDALSTGAENATLACKRIAKMVRSLQSFSQLDQSEFQRADIHDGIESTISLVRARWGNDVEWVTKFGALPAIECYPGALNQALMILLVNAAESIEGSGTVTVATEVSKGRIQLRVSDTGCGIAVDKLQNLFEIGFNRSGARVRMTTGLANVRATVDKHHGSISVESAPGQGTSFVIRAAGTPAVVVSLRVDSKTVVNPKDTEGRASNRLRFQFLDAVAHGAAQHDLAPVDDDPDRRMRAVPILNEQLVAVDILIERSSNPVVAPPDREHLDDVLQLADSRDLADTLLELGFLERLGDVAGQDDDPFVLDLESDVVEDSEVNISEHFAHELFHQLLLAFSGGDVELVFHARNTFDTQSRLDRLHLHERVTRLASEDDASAGRDDFRDLLVELFALELGPHGVFKGLIAVLGHGYAEERQRQNAYD